MDLLEHCGCAGGIVRGRNDSGAKPEQIRLKTVAKNPIEQGLPELWISFSLAVRDSLFSFREGLDFPQCITPTCMSRTGPQQSPTSPNSDVSHGGQNQSGLFRTLK